MVRLPSGEVCMFRYLFIVIVSGAIRPMFTVQNCDKTTGCENVGFIMPSYGVIMPP